MPLETRQFLDLIDENLRSMESAQLLQGFGGDDGDDGGMGGGMMNNPLSGGF